MTVLYADASALVRAYTGADSDLRARLLEGPDPVLTCTLARLELAAAARAAGVPAPGDLTARFDADCLPGGPLVALALRPDDGPVGETAARLLAAHPVGTAAALHLAVALEVAVPLAAAAGDEVVLVTRDPAQAEAARAAGLPA